MSSPRIALITGANKGLGLETARQLGKQGITVLIGTRDLARGAAAVQTLAQDGIKAVAIQLEVTDAASIAAAAAQVAKQYGQLDVLVNNAGVLDYAADTGVETTSIDTFRRVFETNVFGLIAVTQAFLPLLKKSASARIVNLTSILGSIAEHADPNSFIYAMRWPAYDASKAAVNMYTVELAHTLKGTKIKVNAAHPGWVKTDMGGEQAPMEIVDGAKTAVALAIIDDNGPTGGFYHLGVHMRW
jgi:NAD(P)-dependent dehydrogenase (short-subunit alcohol dehydrogenase family)